MTALVCRKDLIKVLHCRCQNAVFAADNGNGENRLLWISEFDSRKMVIRIDGEICQKTDTDILRHHLLKKLHITGLIDHVGGEYRLLLKPCEGASVDEGFTERHEFLHRQFRESNLVFLGQRI